MNAVRWLNAWRRVEAIAVGLVTLWLALLADDPLVPGLLILWLVGYAIIGWTLDNDRWPWESFGQWRRQRRARLVWQAGLRCLPAERERRRTARRWAMVSELYLSVEAHQRHIQQLTACVQALHAETMRQQQVLALRN